MFLICEGRLTCHFILFLWKRKRRAVHGQRGSFIPYAVPWKDPKFAPFTECSLLISEFRMSVKKKKKAMDAEMGQFVIPWETPHCFGSGKKTHPIFQFVSLEKKEESNT